MFGAYLICLALSGPETMMVWTTEGTTIAEQEEQAGRDHWQAWAPAGYLPGKEASEDA